MRRLELTIRNVNLIEDSVKIPRRKTGIHIEKQNMKDAIMEFDKG
jgi:hypothetical protein